VNRIALVLSAALLFVGGLWVSAREPAPEVPPLATPAWDDFIQHLKNADSGRALLAQGGGGQASETNSRIPRYVLFDADLKGLWYIPRPEIFAGGGATSDVVYRYYLGVTDAFRCDGGAPRADHREVLPMAPFVAELWAEARSGFSKSEVTHDGMGNVLIKFPFNWASSISVSANFAGDHLSVVHFEGFDWSKTYWIREIQWDKPTPPFLLASDEASVCSFGTAAGGAELDQWTPRVEPDW